MSGRLNIRKEAAMITYKPLWKTLIDREMNKTDLVLSGIISRGTLAKMSRGDGVKLEVIDRICTHLGCQLTDVIEYVPGEIASNA